MRAKENDPSNQPMFHFASVFVAGSGSPLLPLLFRSATPSLCAVLLCVVTQFLHFPTGEQCSVLGIPKSICKSPLWFLQAILAPAGVTLGLFGAKDAFQEMDL